MSVAVSYGQLGIGRRGGSVLQFERSTAISTQSSLFNLSWVGRVSAKMAKGSRVTDGQSDEHSASHANPIFRDPRQREYHPFPAIDDLPIETRQEMADIEAAKAGGSPVEIHDVVIRFAGDSGDGMQLTGNRFTTVSAIAGNDLSTLPNFPAEIRAPAGTLAGVSAYQLHFSDHDILTPGDAPSVLVAMNPAALKTNLADLIPHGTIIVNRDAFNERNLHKAGFDESPLDDDTLAGYHVFEVPMTSITIEATSDLGVKPRDAERSKNFFALGLVSWMYTRPVEPTLEWISATFGKRPLVADANSAAFKAGYNFAETAELFDHQYHVSAAPLPPGKYRSITGNIALTYGLVAASELSGLRLFIGSYPITPASEILEQLSAQKRFGVIAFQAEDEIAGIGSALGAAFGGMLAVTSTSGPGVDLKSETVGLAVSLELPLVIVDVQRGGPSTGLPTKTEQSDLFQVLYGRHGEAPVPVIAAKSPSDCFFAAIEAARIAVKYRTPVYLLSDGYLANGSEPWRLPEVSSLPRFSPDFATEPNHDGAFWPYLRDPETLARPWAVPGTPGLAHRVGGLEKEDGSGNVSYDPENHETMTRLRAERIDRIALDIPDLEVDEDDGARLLVLGWGSTYGAIAAAVDSLREKGVKVARAHLTHLRPLPRNTGEVLASYEKVLVPELNMGQLVKVIRAEFLVDAVGLNKVWALPFRMSQIEEKVMEVLGE